MTIRGLSLKQNNGFDISMDNQLLLERIGRIVMTYKSERVNNPEFGSLLENFLFNRRQLLAQHVENSLKNTIEMYEPRVSVISSNITYDEIEHAANVYIEVVRKDTREALTFEESIEI